jgi:hypothetical protein
VKDHAYFYAVMSVCAGLLVYANSGQRSIGAPPSVDIVQVDTGTDREINRTLIMPRSCTFRCWHTHGLEMAETLNEELEKQGASLVRGEQVVWRTMFDLPSAIRFAAAKNPKIIALSLSGDEPFNGEKIALMQATSKGILVLAAAGNEGLGEPGFPGHYRMSCFLAVSTSEQGRKVPSANAGDIYIPRAPNDRGTSFSTARAAAIALSYYQKNPEANCHQVKEWLLIQYKSAR